MKTPEEILKEVELESIDRILDEVEYKERIIIPAMIIYARQESSRLDALVMPKIVEGRGKIIKIMADMITAHSGFPSPFIEDNKQKITRKYFQQILTQYDEKIKFYVRQLKEILDSNFSA